MTKFSLAIKLMFYVHFIAMSFLQISKFDVASEVQSRKQSTLESSFPTPKHQGKSFYIHLFINTRSVFFLYLFSDVDEFNKPVNFTQNRMFLKLKYCSHEPLNLAH